MVIMRTRQIKSDMGRYELLQRSPMSALILLHLTSDPVLLRIINKFWNKSKCVSQKISRKICLAKVAFEFVGDRKYGETGLGEYAHVLEIISSACI